MADIKFEIKKTFGVISTSNKGWTKELNLVSWNEKEPKYDIREWNTEHSRMGKGITFTIEELKMIKTILDKMDL